MKLWKCNFLIWKYGKISDPLGFDSLGYEGGILTKTRLFKRRRMMVSQAN